MSIAAKPITADELFAQGSAHGRCELVAGEIRLMTPAGFEHGVIANTLGALVRAFVREQGLGIVCGAETGFIVAQDPDTVLAPDCAFVSKKRLSGREVSKKYFVGTPDLAVEILSPSDRIGEVAEKVRQWLAAGCQAVWVVNPSDRTLTIHSSGERPQLLNESDTYTDLHVLPGLTLVVKELFDLGA